MPILPTGRFSANGSTSNCAHDWCPETSSQSAPSLSAGQKAAVGILVTAVVATVYICHKCAGRIQNSSSKPFQHKKTSAPAQPAAPAPPGPVAGSNSGAQIEMGLVKRRTTNFKHVGEAVRPTLPEAGMATDIRLSFHFFYFPMYFYRSFQCLFSRTIPKAKKRYTATVAMGMLFH
jgi:hypothetical protein